YAVKNFELCVETGEIFGFVGKNGAGKSTTIRSILNIISPSDGSITVLGYDSIKDSKKVKELTSYVPSESVFYDGISCMELLKFSASFSDKPIEDIEKLADFFDLDLSKKINDLSLGNRKKVSLIQAFLKNAKILIFDEPTSGLDPLMQNKFFELVLKAKEEEKTIFLSSHNLSEVEKYCDRVAIIKNGELAELLNMKDVKIRHKQVLTYTTTNGISKSEDINEDINSVVKRLSNLNLSSLEIKNKTVEEEFIDYYKEE
ncbi:MAG: ABC transporter ATP-binding protein, partial [Clostridia bacterium]